MARAKKQEESSSGTAAWMNTYSDLVTLLFAFFVLLFALSQTDEGRVKAFLAGFEGGAGVLDGGAMLEFEKNIGQMLQNSGTSDDEDLEHIQSILEEATEGEISSQITVERNERGTVIRFMNNVLFDAGEAVIRKEAESVMEEVGNLLHSEQFRGHPVAVEGHTDTDPVKYVNKYPTNWELSSARATGVVRFLIEKSGIEPQRLSASGYSFYHPVAPNDTAENKAMNRRVDIVLLNSDVNETPAKTEENNTPEVQSGEGTPDTESTPKVQP